MPPYFNTSPPISRPVFVPRTSAASPPASAPPPAPRKNSPPPFCPPRNWSSKPFALNILSSRTLFSLRLDVWFECGENSRAWTEVVLPLAERGDDVLGEGLHLAHLLVERHEALV